MVAVQGLVFQLKDAVTHMLQEVAVVGHHEQGGAHGGQTLLQPRDHVQVKVVGRFVQHEKFGRFEQHLSQSNPPFFPSTQAQDFPLQIMEVQFSKDFTRPSFEIPSFVGVHGVVGFLQRVAFKSEGQGALVFAHRNHRRTVPYI